MKRRDLIRSLEEMGCVVFRHGRSHDRHTTQKRRSRNLCPVTMRFTRGSPRTVARNAVRSEVLEWRPITHSPLVRRVQDEGFFIRRAARNCPLSCAGSCIFLIRAPRSIPPLSVTIHQGGAILADGSGEDKTVPNIIFRSQKIGGSDVKAFN